ncbi:MAG: exosome complex exonuclease Rrp41 [Candidatus Diapherotrites archaeon]|nr:exosome complex exonuclease Rrp41 [Candidatus Diapherotrites archaeon]
MKEEENVYVNKHGKRIDNRGIDEIREIKITIGVIPEASGSAYLEWGQNKIYAAVYGPNEFVPKHSSDPLRAQVKFNYRMASFSVPDRKNPKPGRREIEISKVLGEALERTIFLERFPGTQIEVETHIVDSNAGSRVAALTAASVALADAGIPMRSLISACGVGKAGGHLIVDLNKHEEDAPDAVDIPLAVMANSNEVVLLQMDGLISKEEFNEVMQKGLTACQQVYEKQKAVLKEKFLDAEKEVPSKEDLSEEKNDLNGNSKPEAPEAMDSMQGGDLL